MTAITYKASHVTHNKHDNLDREIAKHLKLILKNLVDISKSDDHTSDNPQIIAINSLIANLVVLSSNSYDPNCMSIIKEVSDSIEEFLNHKELHKIQTTNDITNFVETFKEWSKNNKHLMSAVSSLQDNLRPTKNDIMLFRQLSESDQYNVDQKLSNLQRFLEDNPDIRNKKLTDIEEQYKIYSKFIRDRINFNKIIEIEMIADTTRSKAESETTKFTSDHSNISKVINEKPTKSHAETILERRANRLNRQQGRQI